MQTILMEFNELSPQLIQKFMAAGKLPNFKRLYEESEVHETEADDPVHLEPWIQWVAVHSDVPFSEHGVEHLGEGTKLAQTSIWDLLSDAGMRAVTSPAHQPPVNTAKRPAPPWASS